MQSRHETPTLHHFRTTIRLTAALLLAVVSLVTFHATSQAATVVVDNSVACHDLSTDTPYCTIQAAIDAASPGDTVEIRNGTYTGSLDVLKDLTLEGESEAGVIIDTSASADYSIDARVSPDGPFNMTFRNFTLIGNSGSASYGLKVAGDDGVVTIENVTVQNSHRSGVDLNGLVGATLTNVTSTGANSGVGIGLTDVSNATLTNITTSGNAWGGVAFYTYGRYYTLGSDNIVLTGANTISDGVYVERGNYNDSTNPAPVTNLTLDGYLYTVENPTYRTGGENFTHYFTNLTDAQTFAAALPTPENSVVEAMTGGEFFVAAGMSIQTAIDAASPGDTVVVDPGTYVEQLVINKPLALEGAGISTVVQAPASMVAQFYTSYDHYPVIWATDSDGIEIRNLLVDGAGNGNGNYKMEGISFYNAGGVVEDVEIKGIRETPFSGAQHGVALYAYNEDGSTRTLAVRNSYIHDFQKNAMAISTGANTTLTVDISGNTVEGAGPTTVTAQNGIQVYQAGGKLTGAIQNNTVTGIGYDNTADSTKWVATSILNYFADVDVINNTVSNAHVGVYSYDGTGAILNNNITIEKIGVSAYGIIATDPPRAVPSPYPPEETIVVAADAGDGTVTAAGLANVAQIYVANNQISFSGPDNTDTFGVEADAGYSNHDIALVANNNTVTGFDVGFELYQCQSSCASGVFTSIQVQDNNISGNTGWGMRSNVNYLTADGTNNWWGDASGPSGEGPGTGDAVSEYIAFNPYRSAPVPATLYVPDTSIDMPGGATSFVLPIMLSAVGDNLSSVAFSLDYDEVCLSIDPTDGNSDGIPDAVAGFPTGFVSSVTLDAADTDGELDIAVWSQSQTVPLGILPDGALLQISFDVAPVCQTDRTVDVLIADSPAPSFGNNQSQTVFRTAMGAAVPLDFNQPATDMNLAPTSVAENQPAGTVVGTLTNNDPDAGLDSYTYTITGGSGASHFSIDGDQLKTVTVFDFETMPTSYGLDIQVDDGQGGVYSASFTVTITDENDPPDSLSLDNDRVWENEPTGALVGTFSATDQDDSSFTYTLVAGPGDDDNGAFSISGDQLLTGVVFNYNNKSLYKIRVAVDDGDATLEETFLIYVVGYSQFSLRDDHLVVYGATVNVPVSFTAGGNAAPTSAGFTVDYDETCLAFVAVNGLQSGYSATPNDNGSQVAVTLSGSAPLANGTMATLQFQANSACATGTGAALLMSGATLADGAGPLPVQTDDGAILVLADDRRGDCNADDLVNAADFTSIILESFDGDGTFWLDVFQSTFVGSPIGCDANGSTHVDVADLVCTVRIVFGDDSCAGPLVTSAAVGGKPARLALERTSQTTAGQLVDVPIRLAGNGHAVAAAAFTVALDPATAAFDPADADGDGIPDAITFNVPEQMLQYARYDAEKAVLEFAVAGLTLPLPQLADGPVATIRLTALVEGDAALSSLVLANASLGNTDGRNVPVVTDSLVSGQSSNSTIFLPVTTD